MNTATLPPLLRALAHVSTETTPALGHGCARLLVDSFPLVREYSVTDDPSMFALAASSRLLGWPSLM